MMKILRLIATFALAVTLLPFVANADDANLMISDAWARPLPAVSKNGAAYITLMNHGSKSDRLISAKSSAAKMIEVHTHVHKDGVMSMQKVDGLEIAPGEVVTFKPGGLHLMLMGLEQEMKEGEAFTIELQFEKAGEMTIEVQVRQPTG